jgi:ABC-type lipoprotein export system ATPase subunit
LDEASAEQLTGVLVQAAGSGMALVIASHDPVLVSAATQILELT